MDRTKLHFETLQLHVGQEQADPATDARAVPIYQTTSYVFHNADDAAARFGLQAPGNIYGRLTNSTQGVFEERVAALEGGIAGLAVASGAAAISYAFENITRAGDHIVAAKTIYGGSYNLLAHTLPTYGVTTTFVDPENLDNFEQAIQENTKAVFIETLGNPNCNIIDIDAVADIAHRHRIPLIIDNTFGTPYLIRPIEHGADIVVHSATKFLGGHGTTLGGIIVDSGKFDWAASGKYPAIAEPNPSYHGVSFVAAAGPAAFVTYIRAVLLRDTGATISPFAAFLLLQGVETLSLRLERHAENTKKVVEFLANHPQVEHVNHPSLPNHPDHALYEKYFPNGGASIFTFEIKGGVKEAHKFIDNLKIFSLLANVADVKSLVIHPATTTHSQLTEAELLDQGTIFMLNAVALFIFPIIGRWLEMDDHQFGYWCAIAIHDTSSVVGAAKTYSNEALAIATTTKLIRALWIIPISLIAAFFYNKGTNTKSKISIPYFIFFYIVAMIIATYTPQWGHLYTQIVGFAKVGMLFTLFLIGAGLSKDTIKQVGFKPILLGIILWICISTLSASVIMLL